MFIGTLCRKKNKEGYELGNSRLDIEGVKVPELLGLERAKFRKRERATIQRR